MFKDHTITARLRLEDMVHHLQCLRRSFGTAVRPAPDGIWDNRTFVDMRAGLYALSDADCTRFPLELTGVVRGNELRAYFDCYPFLGSPQSAHARMSMEEVDTTAAFLRDGSHTPVTEWNLLQLNAAQAFAGLINTPRGGVPYHLVQSFQVDRPNMFRAALDEYVPIVR